MSRRPFDRRRRCGTSHPHHTVLHRLIPPAAIVLPVAAALALAASAASASSPVFARGGWLPQGSGTGYDLTCVTFSDARHGWVGGMGTTLLHTTDGGLCWRQATTGLGITADIASMVFVDDAHGWVVDRSGAVEATTDGGATWYDQDVEGRPFDLVAVDAEHAWTLTGGTGLAATTNGGVGWTTRETGAGSVLNDVAFADDLHGWAVGFDGVIVASTDGGATWRPQASGTAATLDAVSFVDAQRGWVAGWVSGGYGSRALLLATTDGGSTWTTRYAGTGADSSAFTDVLFIDELHGWAASDWAFGGLYDTIEATTDGGATWRVQWTGALGPTAIAMGDSDHLWTVGERGLLLATGDGGASSDTTPPKAVASKVPDRWFDHRVIVHLKASDEAGGSGPAYREWRLDDAKRWTRGDATVSSNGIHTVWYRAVDAAGNVESRRSLKVKIDRKPPRVIGERVSSVLHGGVVTVRYKVADHTPCGPWARGVKLIVTKESPYEGELTDQVVRIGTVRVNTWHTVTFTSHSAAGLHGVSMTCRDDAGNHGAGFFGFLRVR